MRSEAGAAPPRAETMTDQGCALVTGASRGIGAAIAIGLARDGWPVGVNYRSDEEAARRVVQQIESEGGSAIALPADVVDREQAERMFEPLEERWGRVLVLVNNAGIRADALSLSIGDEEWSRVLDTNLTAAFWLMRRAIPQMVRMRFGRVINVSSVAGTHAAPGQANYAASKSGLIALTKSVAAEVAKRGVTVNAVCPGYVETDMTADVPREVLVNVPSRRFGTPEEIAACVRFLAAPQASYVTGTTLVCDGGYSA